MLLYDYIYLLHQQLNYTTTTNHHCTFPPQCPSTLLLLLLEAVWAFLYQDELGKAMLMMMHTELKHLTRIYD